MDWHTVVAILTVAAMLIGAVVELVYRPARAYDLEALRFELRDLREEVRVRLAVLEDRDDGPTKKDEA